MKGRPQRASWKKVLQKPEKSEDEGTHAGIATADLTSLLVLVSHAVRLPALVAARFPHALSQAAEVATCAGPFGSKQDSSSRYTVCLIVAGVRTQAAAAFAIRPSSFDSSPND